MPWAANRIVVRVSSAAPDLANFDERYLQRVAVIRNIVPSKAFVSVTYNNRPLRIERPWERLIAGKRPINRTRWNSTWP